MASDCDCTLVDNKKAKSHIWAFFRIKKSKTDGSIDERIAVCKTCNVTVKTGGGTTNMTNHMRRHHPHMLSSKNSLVKSTVSLTFGSGQQAATSGASQQTVTSQQQVTLMTDTKQSTLMMSLMKNTPARKALLTKAICKFLVKDLRPYSTVESKEFREMAHAFDPNWNYVIPSRKHFSDTLVPEVYNAIKETLKTTLSKAVQVVMTTDGWTSRANQSYVAITASFIVDWTIHSLVLQTRELPESHTVENVARVLQEAITVWRLKLRLGIMLVTDNAPNMKAAVRIFNATLHLGCFAHTLNIAVRRALKVEEVDNTLRRIRRIVSFFHRSSQAATLLEHKAVLLGMSATKLKIDVAKRWNSAHDMLERFLVMHDAVVAVISSKELSGLRERDVTSLSDDEVLAAEDVFQFLKPMKTMTVMLSSENLPTASLVLPLLHSLVGANGHLTEREADSAVVSRMKQVMRADLVGRYDGQERQLAVITALDPRFKHLGFMSEEKRHHTYNHVVEQAVIAGKPTVKAEAAASTSVAFCYHISATFGLTRVSWASYVIL